MAWLQISVCGGVPPWKGLGPTHGFSYLQIIPRAVLELIVTLFTRDSLPCGWEG